MDISFYIQHFPTESPFCPDGFSYKVENLDCTDDGETSEESHGASNCRQHVHKLCRSVLGDFIYCWGVEEYPHISQIIFPFSNTCKS